MSPSTPLPGKQDISKLDHWRVTLTVFNIGAMMLQIAYQSYTASSMATTIYNLGTLAFALMLYGWTKDYVDHYVKTSKI